MLTGVTPSATSHCCTRYARFTHCYVSMPGTYHINQDIRPCLRPIYMYLVCQHGACERGKYVYGVWPKKPHIVNDKMQERSRYFTTCCVEREDPPPQSSSRRVLVSVVFPG